MIKNKVRRIYVEKIKGKKKGYLGTQWFSGIS